MEPEILIGLMKTLGTGTTIMIASSVLSGMINHITLVRRDNRDFKIDALPPVLKVKDSINLDFLDERVASIIEEFTETMSTLPHVDLSGFYMNYAPYKIMKSQNPKFKKFGYNVEKDMIVLNPNRDIKNQLIPCLLDMASTYRTDSIEAVGFMRINTGDYNRIGQFLHTAYEAIVTSRYFGIDFASERDVRIAITLFIEQIVGRENMESAFFRGALDEIVDKLSSYSTREDAVKVIRELDHLRTVIIGKSKIAELLSVYTYRDVVLKLSKMYIKKLESEPPFNPYEAEERLNILNDFILKGYISGFIRYTPTEKMVNEIAGFLRCDKPNNITSRGGL